MRKGAFTRFIKGRKRNTVEVQFSRSGVDQDTLLPFTKHYHDLKLPTIFTIKQAEKQIHSLIIGRL